MTPERFIELLVSELEETPALRTYYKLLASAAYLEFRKSYLIARLRFVQDCLAGANEGAQIWDFGCGFGTTALFLAMNNFNVRGSTLGEVPGVIRDRKKFWSRYGDAGRFTEVYENLFSSESPRDKYDFIIAQDTLHHLEPIDAGLRLLRNALKPGGKFIVVEENGQNILQSAKLYLRRGNNRISEVDDKVSGKKVLVGNENIRGFDDWRMLFEKAHLNIIGEPSYVRFYLPYFCGKMSAEEIMAREEEIARRRPTLRTFFFFGINFLAYRSGDGF